MRVPRGVLYIAAGTLLTLSLGLYNNFPFLYPDTAAYLASGIELSLPWDRPIFYGLFLRACHMMDNLYFCIFVQSLLVASVTYLPFYALKGREVRGPLYLLTILFLTLTTSWSFFANYLTADFFAVVLFICTWLLLFVRMRTGQAVVLIVLLCYALLVHKSHFLLFGGTLIMYFLLTWITRYRPIPIKRALALAGTTLVVALLTNFLVIRILDDGKPRENGTLLFLTAKLNETGILHEFLNRKCDEKNYPICPYRDEITSDFLWHNNSPRLKEDVRAAGASGYRRMLGDMISDPLTLKRIIVMSFNMTMLQLFTFEIEPHAPLHLSYVEEQFPVHRFDMDASFQNRGNRLNFDKLNNRQWMVVLTSLTLLLLFLISGSKASKEVRLTILFTLCFLLVNAWVFGTVASVHSRFQGRVIWLLPFMTLFWWPTIYSELRRMLLSAFGNSARPPDTAA